MKFTRILSLGHRNSDQLDSGVGPSVDDEMRPETYNCRDEQRIPLIPNDTGLQRDYSYSPPGSSSKTIVDFHPPADLRNSNEYLEKMQCSTDREPPHQFYNPTQQIHPEYFESIHELSMFPHDTTDESIKFTGNEQDLTEEPISGTPSRGQSATPQFSRGSSAEMSSRLRRQDALFEPSDIDTDNLMIAPSEIATCSSSSIHSSDQELALQMINMEEDWSL